MCGMGSDGVVIVFPFGQYRPCVVQGREQGFIQAFVAQFALEALDKPVLHRLARRNVMPRDLPVLSPLEDGHTGQFRAIIADNGCRFVPGLNQLVKHPGYPLAGQGCIGNQRRFTLSGSWIGARVPSARFRPPRLRT